MASSIRGAIKKLLKEADRAETQAAKGKIFEEIACRIFEQIPGVSVGRGNALDYFESEEIDIALSNEKHPNGLYFLDWFLLIEFKNWSKPVGSAEVVSFISKIRNRGLDFGIMIAANGITGNAGRSKNAHQQVVLARADKIWIIVITKAEIETLTSGSDLVKLIKQKISRLLTQGTVWP